MTNCTEFKQPEIIDFICQSIDGMEYMDEINIEMKKFAKKNRISIVFGYSDDCLEMRGFTDDEFGAWEGVTIVSDAGREITAVRCHDKSLYWKYETDIEHRTFKVMDDEEVYCYGIVFKELETETEWKVKE